ncbi:MAG: extracellular solute-binding protein, partial [Nitratireductor sp.]|nr:extracellular solute-binding protein [Nitratireductor sp.]
PVEELARQYDLIIIDHPHVGQVVSENCLHPLDGPERRSECEALAAGSVGQSWTSYFYAGRQWALPVDTATQVQAFVPSRLAASCHDWDGVMRLAQEGRVALPLRPPHSLMCVFSLVAHLGSPCATDAAPLIDEKAAGEVYDRLQALFEKIDQKCLEMDPIAVFEEMAQRGSNIACVPLIYGYVSYAQDGFRPQRIAFADMPVIAGREPNGSTLGGTGLSVSAFSKNKKAAEDFAFWVASGPVQAGLYAASGGQPGHADAWESEDVNRPVHDFYRATRRTLEGAWVRPRHDGYMAFQQAGSDHVNACLKNRRGAREFAQGLNALFERSFNRA